MKKTIYIYSAGRSDIDRYHPFVKSLSKFKNVKLKIIPSNIHFLKKYGLSINEIKKKQFPYFKMRIKPSASDNMAKKKDIDNLINIFKNKKPDLLIVLGDRYEMLVAATIATGFNIPIVHLFGGAVTYGSKDEIYRHAISKISNIHFVAHSDYAKRLYQLGEEKWRIKIIGMPELNYLKKIPNYSNEQLKEKFKIDLKKPTFLVNFHPLTYQTKKIKYCFGNLLKALSKFDNQLIFTYPNADEGNEIIIKMMNNFVKKNINRSIIIKNAGDRVYKNLLVKCKLIIGNSSSGIVEAASFSLPSVNIGDRQKGKIIPKNVVNCNYKIEEIIRSIKKSQSKYFKKKIRNIQNPYFKNLDVMKIADFISNIKINEKLFKKNFINFYKNK